MMFWIIAGAVCAVLFALAWWSSGRSKGHRIDAHRTLIQSDEYARSQEHRVQFDPGGPFFP
jgi:Flp pilus assembly protein TadB